MKDTSNNTKQQAFTLDQAKSLITELGGTPLNGASWEDDRAIYASSVETVPGCYGHPRYEVMFSKESHWLSVSGRKPIRLD